MISRSKNKLLYGTRNKSSSLLTLNELNELEKSSDWRKNYIVKPKEIGRGHFSKVFLVTCETKNKSFAAKVIRRRKAGIDRLDKIRKEAEIIKRLNNKKIISVIQLYETFESFSEVVLICELAKGGSLFNLVYESDSGLDQVYVNCVVYKILLALESMHLENIVHLDIKADNILLREPYPSTNIAICDFGLATELKKGISHKELIGTPDYMAPEVVNYEKITFNSDMWSVGVITYYLLTQISPFMGHTKDETLMNVSKAKIEYDSIFNQTDFQNAKDFISSLCVKAPNLRLSSTSAQLHVWFENISDLDIDYPLQSQISMNISKSYISENNSYCPIIMSSSQRCQSIDVSSFSINTKFMIENTETDSLVPPTYSLENICCNDLDIGKSEAIVNGTINNNHSHQRNLSKQLTFVNEVTDELSFEQNGYDMENDPLQNHENQVNESHLMWTESKFYSTENNENSISHHFIIPEAPIDLSINLPPISINLKNDENAIDNYCIIPDSVVNHGIIPIPSSIDLKDFHRINENSDSSIDNYCIIHDTLTNHSSIPPPLSIDFKENEMHTWHTDSVTMVTEPKQKLMYISNGDTLLKQYKFNTSPMKCTDPVDGYYLIPEGSVVPDIVLSQPPIDMKASLYNSSFDEIDQKPSVIDNNNIDSSMTNQLAERSDITTIIRIDTNFSSHSDLEKHNFDSGFSESNLKFPTSNLNEYDNISNTSDHAALSGETIERNISFDKESSTSYGDEYENDLNTYTSLWTHLRLSEFCILL